jgi:CheY-like chemotaxis protein
MMPPPGIRPAVLPPSLVRPPAAPPDAAPPPESAAATNAGLPLVLVGDDDPAIRELVSDVLAEAGFRSVRATNGEEVMDLAVRQKPALIVLDVIMPKMDGYTTLTRLRGNRVTRDIPVVILTGQPGPIYQTLSYGAGPPRTSRSRSRHASSWTPWSASSAASRPERRAAPSGSGGAAALRPGALRALLVPRMRGQEPALAAARDPAQPGERLAHDETGESVRSGGAGVRAAAPPPPRRGGIGRVSRHPPRP